MLVMTLTRPNMCTRKKRTCCSQGTFINSELGKKLRIEGTMATIKIPTLNGEKTQETEAILDLRITSTTGKNA